MAYAIKYVFTFQSQNGDEFQIQIEKDGYSGATINRCLGKAPVLKRERNGHICGSSLEIYAECQVDGELAEFYTSDPKMFRVSLVNVTTNRVLFRGYVSPELYSEPDIAPPYDVQIIATDGLGELRRYLYEPMGDVSLATLLEYLLGKTGLPGYFRHNNNTLTAGGSSEVPAADFFNYALINLDYLAGKPCYDVLTTLLDSVHADIFQSINSGQTYYWQIVRETDVERGSSVVVNRSPSGYDETVVPQGFGSMRNYGWWPVGQMETQVKPACKRLTVLSDAHYKDALVNGAMTEDRGWTKYNAAFDDTLGYYLATAGYIEQAVSFQTPVQVKLKLSVSMRQYRATSSDPSAEGTARIQVTMLGSTYSGRRTYYLVNDADDGYKWQSESGYITVDLPAPFSTDTNEDCIVTDIELPLAYVTRRQYAKAESMTVRISRVSANVPLVVHSASLTCIEQIAGYRDVFSIDNGARDDADDVNSVFLPASLNFYSTPAEFMYGVLRDYGLNIINVFTQVGTDYAKSCALPRLRKTGTLNVPAGGVMPFVMRDSNGDNYLVQTAEWDLLSCEMTVELLSLPAASVVITGQAVSELIYQGGTAVSGGSSSSSGGGGGGGGGGTVTSVGLEMPSGFSVSNSPITGAGTLRVTLDNTLAIPTTTERVAWNTAVSVSHSHPNKVQLDRITQHGADFLAGVDENMLAVAPTIKKFWLQANTSTPTQEQPFFFIRHPLIRMGADAELCLMVYRKRNGGSGTRKTHRKGWFLACGEEHAAGAAWVQPVATAVSGSTAVQVIDILDGVARTYCQIYGAVHNQDYADWLFRMTQIGPDFTSFGFAGTPEAVVFKRKLHLGIALRVENPDFTNLVDPQRTLHADTGSIQGVPRYLYSAVAPLTARMYAEAKSGQPRGGVAFDLI